MSCVLVKSVAGVVDYTLDWSDILGADTISTSSWTATGGVVVDSKSNTTTKTTAVISSGDRGAMCELANTVVTAGAKTHQRTVVVRILDI